MHHNVWSRTFCCAAVFHPPAHQPSFPPIQPAPPRRFFAALNARDWGALQLLLAPDCILQNMACDVPAIGAEVGVFKEGGGVRRGLEG
jgi:hypothetical protein